MEETTIDVRTPFEKARDERNGRICERFRKYSEQMPHLRPYRIIRLVADEEDMSVPGVKWVLQKFGLYTTNSNKQSK